MLEFVKVRLTEYTLYTAANDKVIPKYGVCSSNSSLKLCIIILTSSIKFDSSSGLHACYATFTDSNAASTPIPNHGFRVHKSDPLFVDWLWPDQVWNKDPANMLPKYFPTAVKSGGKWADKRMAVQTTNPTQFQELEMQ